MAANGAVGEVPRCSRAAFWGCRRLPAIEMLPRLPLPAGLFPALNLFPHSCVPNCAFIVSGEALLPLCRPAPAALLSGHPFGQMPCAFPASQLPAYLLTSCLACFPRTVQRHAHMQHPACVLLPATTYPLVLAA
jgi:hypothetical protein